DRVLARALAAGREVRRGRARVALQVAAIAIERVPRDVEAERLLLEREELLGAPRLELGVGLAVTERRVVATARAFEWLGLHEAEQRRLAAASIALLGRAALERGIEHREQLRAMVTTR